MLALQALYYLWQFRRSVCPSVRLSHAGFVSKWRHIAWCSLHCQWAKCVLFCKNQKIFPRDDRFPLKSWLQVTYPVLIAASLDKFCLVAPQRQELSKKCSIMMNRKSYTGFQISHQPRFYTAPNFLKMGINYLNLSSFGQFQQYRTKSLLQSFVI